MEPNKNDCIDVAIPKDAVEVKVTNMINPYYIRIYEVAKTCTRNNNLTRVLQKIEKSQLKKKNLHSKSIALGDNVIVSLSSINDEQYDLPDWICRGIVTDTTSNSSEVFLIDYGIAINVPTKSLVQYKDSQVPVEHFTLTVGLYNIVPLDSKLCVQKDWSDNTLNFIRQLFQVSKKIYFQVLANDYKNGKLYGDFFLVIEERNICLSKILICSLKAVPLAKELKAAIKNDTDEPKISFSYQMNTSKDNEKVSQKKNENVTTIEKKKFYTKNKFLNKEKMLIRSELSIEPLEHLSEARFTSGIHKALNNNGVRTPKHIQTYMWPAVRKGFDTVAVGTTESGKTIGYLVPMISCVTNREENTLENKKSCLGAQPIVLILCTNISDCIYVADNCNRLLYEYKSVKCYAAFNGISDKTLMTKILNKFNILITTPPFLLRLLDSDMFAKKIDFSDLSCLILDKADLILEKYRQEVLTLIKRHNIIDSGRQNLLHSGKMQVVAVSDTWTERLQSFIEVFIPQPYVCIGSFVEAAAYCKVRGRMLICHSKDKMNKLLDVLMDYSKNKTMIFCINSEEAIKLNNFLLSQSVTTLLVHEDMEILKIEAIKEVWDRCLSGIYPVVICTDQVAFELDISDIEFVIHYTVTNISKTKFSQRFFVFMDHWIQETKNNCKVMVLFDETKENVHFKGVINVLKRLKVDLPSDWDQIADGLDMAADLKKKHYPICDQIKMFGYCKNNSCTYRHRVMADADKPTFHISIGDELKLIILATHGANYLTARIMEVIKTCEKTGSKTIKEYSYSIEATKLQTRLKNFFANSLNRVSLKDVVVGKICALRYISAYSRVQVLKVIEYDPKTEKPRIVRLRSVDDGKIHEKAFVYDLFELPENLASVQLPVIEVILVNIAPFDEETKWTDLATTECNDWYKREITSTVNAYAKVLLQIGNCIFTESLIASRKSKGYENLKLSSLKDSILKNGHATKNESHLESLVNLCINGGITEINGSPIKLPEKNKNSLDDCD